MKLLTFNGPLRYLIVVICGYGVDFIVYSALITMAMSIYWANAVGFCVGTVVNILLIRKFVFPNSRFKLKADLLLTFVINGLMLGVGMCLLWVLVNLVLINPYGAKLLANGVTFTLNYIIRAVFFRKK
jgi:putative flippase GtrA